MVGLRPLKVYIALNKDNSLGYLGNPLSKYTAWYLKLGSCVLYSYITGMRQRYVTWIAIEEFGLALVKLG